MTTKSQKGIESDYMKAQIAEMLSPLNRYYAGQVLGHSPNEDESALYFVLSGASADFERRWKEK